jgi:adenosylcobinamide kinase / adenosylcobinamide-phosphate guanylyltransferase
LHFITGGAFNGKRAWVKRAYKRELNGSFYWLSAYDNGTLPADLIEIHQELMIVEGVEMWLKELTEIYDSYKCREILNSCIDNWLVWEKAQLNRNMVVIGTDITKGIVPLNKEDRKWRDVTGWVYQDIAAKSEAVSIIWYGINQTIK